MNFVQILAEIQFSYTFAQDTEFAIFVRARVIMTSQKLNAGDFGTSYLLPMIRENSKLNICTKSPQLMVTRLFINHLIWWSRMISLFLLWL